MPSSIASLCQRIVNVVHLTPRSHLTSITGNEAFMFAQLNIAGALAALEQTSPKLTHTIQALLLRQGITSRLCQTGEQPRLLHN